MATLDDLAALLETLDLLADSEAMADVRTARAEIDAGTTVVLVALHRRA